jgi:hypothetical protein
MHLYQLHLNINVIVSFVGFTFRRIARMEFMKALFPLDYRRIYRRASGVSWGA